MDFAEQNFRIQEMYEKSLLQKQELKNVVDTAVEKKAIEITKKLLEQKLNIQSISEATGLNIEQIKEIAKQIKS